PAAAGYRAVARIVARQADAVLCVSGDLEQRMRKLGARGVTRALVPAPPAPPGVCAQTLAGLRAGLGLAGHPGSAPVILSVARLARQKGLGTLIEAAAGWQETPRPCPPRCSRCSTTRRWPKGSARPRSSAPGRCRPSATRSTRPWPPTAAPGRPEPARPGRRCRGRPSAGKPDSAMTLLT